MVAEGWSSYLGTVFGFGGGIADFGGLDVDWGALVIITLVTILLAVGTKLSAHFSLAITIIKVSVVLLVVIVGAFYIKAANFTPFIPPNEAGAGGGGADQSLFSLLTGAAGSGTTAGTACLPAPRSCSSRSSGSMSSPPPPRKPGIRSAMFPAGSWPRSASSPCSMSRFRWCSRAWSPTTVLRDAPDGHANLATAFEANGVHWAAKVISIGALAGLTTVVIVLMLGQTRVLFAMSRDGLLPRRLAVTGSHGTPVRITVIVGVLVAIAASVFPMGTPRGDGEHRHVVRVRTGLGRCHRVASEPP